MKHFTILVIILFYFSQGILSQRKQPVFQRKFNFYAAPFSLINYMPRVRVGAEYEPGGKLAYCLDIGYGFSDLIPNTRNIYFLYNRYYDFIEIRPEIKYYYIKRKNYGFYNSIEPFFMHAVGNIDREYFIKRNTSDVYSFDRATLRKFKAGLHFKVGWKGTNKGNVTFDSYIGLGLAYRIYSYSDIVNMDHHNMDFLQEWFTLDDRYEGEKFRFHITTGLKIGYTFDL